LEEIRLGHSSTEQRPEIADVKNRVHHKRPASSLVLCTGGMGMAILWFPARAVRAHPFSGFQHGQCGHGCSLVPNTGGAWSGGGALSCCRQEKRRRRTEERREEKSVAWRRRRIEERREEKRDLDWS